MHDFLLQVSLNTGVCSKHFRSDDYFAETTFRGTQRQRLRLKPGAIPTVFTDYPKFAQPKPIEQRSTMLSVSDARRCAENQRMKGKIEEFLDGDKITSLQDLHQKLLKEKLPTGFRYGHLRQYQ